jgi:predicted nucleic acid-binding protein
MMKRVPPKRLPGVTYVISDTGPLISVFQSHSFGLLTQLFGAILVSLTCFDELREHGWEAEIDLMASHLYTLTLTVDEKQRALTFGQQVAQHAETNDRVAEHHLGEAEAIVLAMRPEYHNDLLLIDETAARSVAKEVGVKFSGFPGVLLLAVQTGLISAKELKTRLTLCRSQGTHYGELFIQQVYQMAKQQRRLP